jgi:hypothetical protein
VFCGGGETAAAEHPRKCGVVAGGHSRLGKNTPMPHNRKMGFIETSTFTKLIYNDLAEDEYLARQVFLFHHPARAAREKCVGVARAKANAAGFGSFISSSDKMMKFGGSRYTARAALKISLLTF